MGLALLVASSADGKDTTARAEPPVSLSIIVNESMGVESAQYQITALVERVVKSLGGTVELRAIESLDLVKLGAEPRAGEMRIQLPRGASRGQFIRALAADDVCRKGTEECAAHCELLAQLSPDGHWHLSSPEGAGRCLVFANAIPLGDGGRESRLALRQAVRKGREEFGLGRRRLRMGKLLISFGRPDFGVLDDDD